MFRLSMFCDEVTAIFGGFARWIIRRCVAALFACFDDGLEAARRRTAVGRDYGCKENGVKQEHHDETCDKFSESVHRNL